VVASPARAHFRFYAELNDHLPEHQRHKTLEKSFFVPGTVKDMIESFGVPHTEVELIVVNSESVAFSHVIRNGDRIAVYPMFESFDITGELKVRQQALREPKFILDVHLGKLAAYLRMLGFDAAYRNCSGDRELVDAASQQQRILLTRDRGLLKHSSVTHGYLVRQTDSRRQLVEIMARFDLAGSVRPFTRCMVCNGSLEQVSSEQVQSELPPLAASSCEQLCHCAQCGRTYWKGSHYHRMQQWVKELIHGAAPVPPLSSGEARRRK
jgi:uncharacterized protein with PIN domain